MKGYFPVGLFGDKHHYDPRKSHACLMNLFSQYICEVRG